MQEHDLKSRLQVFADYRESINSLQIRDTNTQIQEDT